jgi:hypothetical protein
MGIDGNATRRLQLSCISYAYEISSVLVVALLVSKRSPKRLTSALNNRCFARGWARFPATASVSRSGKCFAAPATALPQRLLSGAGPSLLTTAGTYPRADS